MNEGFRYNFMMIDNMSYEFSMSMKAFITDIDGTLLGDADGLLELLTLLEQTTDKLWFGVATGRHLDSAVAVLQEWNVRRPDFFITSVGTEIHEGKSLILDEHWRQHINDQWYPQAIREIASQFSGLILQPKVNQREFKISYQVTQPKQAPSAQELRRTFQQHRVPVNIVFSHGEFLDFLPIRASKGQAIQHLAAQWNIPQEKILVSGDSGNDEDMLKAGTFGVVVGNYNPELEKLRKLPKIYFAQAHYASGILEGMRHFNFLDEFS
jgi:sucrose-phosphate synthase